MKKIIAILCAIVILCGLFAGCATKEAPKTEEKPAEKPATSEPAKTETPEKTEEASSDVFKLGFFSPMSGPTGQYGTEAHKAVQLCVKQINEAGGFNGQKVEIIAYDTTSSTEEAAKIAVKLAEVDKVDAAIMPVMSGEIMAAAPTLTDAKIIAFGPATSPSWMKEEWPYIYRAAMCNDDTMPLLIDLLNQLQYTKVAVFKGTDENAVTTANSLREACEKANIEILIEESYDTGDQDYSAQVLNIIAKDPEIVFISVNGEVGGVIVKQLRQLGYNGMIMSKESFMKSQIEIAGEENSDYICFAMPYVTYSDINDCDIPTMRTFLEAYVAEYGELPQTDSSYRGYEACRTLWEATKIAGKNDLDSLVEAMKQVKYDGLGGTLDFTQSRNGYSTFNQFILVGGKNVLFKDWLTNGGYDAYMAETGRAK